MRVAARKDTPQAQIVAALREVGVQVFILNDPGLPDLLCWSARIGWLPLEVKDGSGRLTPAQRETHALAPYPVVRSVDEALRLFGVDG